jgi:hypothetical protein
LKDNNAEEKNEICIQTDDVDIFENEKNIFESIQENPKLDKNVIKEKERVLEDKNNNDFCNVISSQLLKNKENKILSKNKESWNNFEKGDFVKKNKNICYNCFKNFDNEYLYQHEDKIFCSSTCINFYNTQMIQREKNTLEKIEKIKENQKKLKNNSERNFIKSKNEENKNTQNTDFEIKIREEEKQKKDNNENKNSIIDQKKIIDLDDSFEIDYFFEDE